MLDYILRFFGKGNIDIKAWGSERAVLDLLGEADKAWVSLRYELSLDYVEQSDVVLDAACGSGFGTEILAGRAKRVYGVDISKEAIQYASQRHKRESVEFRVGDVKAINFENDFFDVTVGIETLEHLMDYETYLEEVKRVTKNDGKVIISTPQKKSENPLTPFHVREFEYYEFKKILQKYFVLEKVIGLKRVDKPVFSVVNDQNYKEFDIYLAICRNLKYIEEHYSDEYYMAVNSGFLMNPVGQIYTKAISLSIIGSTVLSIGCGTGILEKNLIELNPDLQITGTDINLTPFLKKLRLDNGLERFYVVKAEDQPKQPFEDDCFDTVYTSHVLEHVPDPKIFILESIRLAKKVALHLVPINLYNPDHIHFFRFSDIDNEYRTQEADMDLKLLADEIVEETRLQYPEMFYQLEVVCPRDGSVDYGDMEFPVKREDRPDGLMPCFLIKFYKNGVSIK